MPIFQLHFKREDHKIEALKAAAKELGKGVDLRDFIAADLISVTVQAASYRDIFHLGILYQTHLQTPTTKP